MSIVELSISVLQSVFYRHSHCVALSPGILKTHTQNVELKQMVINKLEELGSFEYTKNYLDKLESELVAELAKFPENLLMKEWLKPILFNYIV